MTKRIANVFFIQAVLVFLVFAIRTADVPFIDHGICLRDKIKGAVANADFCSLRQLFILLIKNQSPKTMINPSFFSPYLVITE